MQPGKVGATTSSWSSRTVCGNGSRDCGQSPLHTEVCAVPRREQRGVKANTRAVRAGSTRSSSAQPLTRLSGLTPNTASPGSSGSASIRHLQHQRKPLTHISNPSFLCLLLTERNPYPNVPVRSPPSSSRSTEASEAKGRTAMRTRNTPACLLALSWTPRTPCPGVLRPAPYDLTKPRETGVSRNPLRCRKSVASPHK